MEAEIGVKDPKPRCPGATKYWERKARFSVREAHTCQQIADFWSSQLEENIFLLF